MDMNAQVGGVVGKGIGRYIDDTHWFLQPKCLPLTIILQPVVAVY